ncbi:MAG: ABC transporter substrate-binding protein [Chloroflexi bacterium]|nr:ABC transporter substrate-binding protein [Chloroflexota bacterium]
MSERRRVLLTALLFLAALVGAVACSAPAAPSSPAGGTPAVSAPAGGSAPAGSSAPAAANAPQFDPMKWTQPKDPNAKPGGIFNVHLASDIPNVDPHFNQTTIFNTWNLIPYDRLLFLAWGPGIGANDRVLTPGLAERWEMPDDRTYVFHLRRGVKFHNIPPVNGREMTSDDVLYSYERLKGSPFGFALEDTEKMEAPDKYTFKITLKRPSVSFLDVGPSNDWPCTCIVAREAGESVKGDFKNGPVIGTGPYLFGEWKRSVSVSYKKNPDYWESGLPYMDGIETKIVPDAATANAAWRTGQLDFLSAWSSIDAPTREAVKRSNPDMVWYRNETNAPTTHLGLRLDQPPFNDLNVRKAVSKVMDRQDIIDTVYLGDGHMNFTHFQITDPKFVLPMEKVAPYYKRDVAEAKKLMAASAYPNGYDIEIAVSNGFGQVMFTGTELIAGWLKEIGINAKIKNIERAAYNSDILTEGKFQHAYYGPIPGYGDVDGQLKAAYHSKGQKNVFRVKDAELDKLIDEQGVQFDQTKRQQILWKIQERLLDNVDGVFLFASLTQEGLHPWIKNYHRSAARYGDRVFRTVWLDQSLKKK